MNPDFSNSDYDRLQSVLTRADAEHNASEVHGVICGAICNRSKSARRSYVNDLIAAVVGVGNESQPALEASVDSLCESSRQSLTDRDSSFSLLLPGDDEDLAERTAAVAEWCRGFVLGLLSDPAVKLDDLPGGVAEIAQDFMAISEAEPGSDQQQDEWALAEIEEYVRVGVQLIFEELHADAGPPE